MARFGLIGHPIFHSQSPALFRAAYGESKDTYELIESESIEKAMERFLREDFAGINVTAPFKDAAMNYAAFPDRISSLLGSTNLLLKRPEGIFSYNTDYYGVRNTITALASRPEALPPSLRDKGVKTAIVIGAGGAGKAATLALADLGMTVALANRTLSKAAPFARAAGAECLSLDEIGNYLSRADLVVYSLSFKIPQLEQADLKGKVLFEANYAKPAFLPNKHDDNLLYISGKYWLYNQAVPAFELFTGRKPNLLRMRKIIGIR